MNVDSPFQAITAKWVENVRLAEKSKEAFQATAEEGMRFFNGPYQFAYDLENIKSGAFKYTGLGDKFHPPTFQMSINKVAEAVQLFGPVLYNKNPNRMVSPREVPLVAPEIFGDINDPMVQAVFMPMVQQVQQARATDKARAGLLEQYLNYTPMALDLKTEMRSCIDEALIKGRGVMWHEVYRPKGAKFQMVGSFNVSVDNIFIDPDAENLADANYIICKYIRPVWRVESEYGLPPGTLKGNLESHESQAAVDSSDSGKDLRNRGEANDLIVYWKIYSKMGLGGLLKGAKPTDIESDRYGQYCMLVVCESCKFPLNIPPMVWGDDEAIRERVQWETPYWADDAWPCTFLDFHPVPRSVWPQSHFQPAMGELKFLNWAYSFLASKMHTVSKDYIAVLKGASEEIKRVIQNGTDLEFIEIEKAMGSNIGEIIQFLSHPPLHANFIDAIQLITDNFEKRTGLSELMYGETPRQLRSASEAQVKSDQMRIRPDDMANRVEDFSSSMARKEALAARWHLDPQRDIKPILGDVGAYWWGNLVATTDISVLIHQLEYRIEEGSVAKPNRAKEAADANNAMQQLAQPYFQLAAQGVVGPFNALVEKWAHANQMDGTKLMLPEPPPPQPMMAPGQEPPPPEPQGQQ